MEECSRNSESINMAGMKRNSENNVGKVSGGQIVKALECQVQISFCKNRELLMVKYEHMLKSDFGKQAY